jgi:hypothetical protein
MIPQVGQHVKCLLRTGVLAEGIVEDWGERTVQLRSLDEENILIITHPNDDIMLIKVVLNTHQSAAEKVAEKIRRAGPERPVPESADLKQKFQEVYDSPSDDDLRLKELADLKIMLIEQEKKIIADKLKSHHIGPVNKAKYGYPGFLTKPSTK